MSATNLTFDVVEHMLPGQGDSITTFMAHDEVLAGQTQSELVTSGALSTKIATSRLSVTATVAYTLADGTSAGQRKRIECVVAASVPAGTLTIASPETAAGMICSATFFFDTLGQALELIWTGTKWRATRVERAGGLVDNVVVGTTVLTGKNMWKRYNCSVTNTVNSTGTQALPNGSAVGEQIWLTNTTVGGTPIGSIDGVYTAGIVTAYTHAGTIGVVASATAVGDSALLVWSGTAWDVVYQSGITFS